MSITQEMAYFTQRERAEQELADRAQDPATRCVHRTMAANYRQRLRIMQNQLREEALG